MKLYVYDCEVFAHDWLVVMKDYKTGDVRSVWNDNEIIKEWFSEEDSVFIGFNSKGYDNFIIQAIRSGFSPEEVKEVNDFIIFSAKPGWEFPGLKYDGRIKYGADIKDDMRAGLSLKSIEGHLGKNIEETHVDFNINRPLTQEERDLTEFYCKYDVATTYELVQLRKDYLNNKIKIGQLANIKPEQALCMTNAKLTAEVLQANGNAPTDDERKYVLPDYLRADYHIPKEVFDFFARLNDVTIPNEELFSSKLDIRVGHTEVTLGFGGIHGAIPNYTFTPEEAKGADKILVNFDVASYYPNLMIRNGYQSRAIPDKNLFENIVNKRLEAKRTGDTATATALKLVVNTCYGAMLNKYNKLYDPLMARSVCISGQLYLLLLAYKMPKDVKIVQLNTDGIMLEIPNSEYEIVKKTTEAWEAATGFILEEDEIKTIYQKDVNNYIARLANGKVKKKGGYLVRGISSAGAFNINNTAPIVSKAIEEYLLNGVAVEKTIYKEDDILQFQFIAKAGHKYAKCFHIVAGKLEPVQMANRVYASVDQRLGTLIKEKRDGSQAKIENLPTHCLIDNANKATLSEVDKEFYIDLANKRIADFIGIDDKKGAKLWQMQ